MEILVAIILISTLMLNGFIALGQVGQKREPMSALVANSVVLINTLFALGVVYLAIS